MAGDSVDSPHAVRDERLHMFVSGVLVGFGIGSIVTIAFLGCGV